MKTHLQDGSGIGAGGHPDCLPLHGLSAVCRTWCSVAEVLTRVLGVPVDSGKLEAGGIVWLCAVCFGQGCGPSPLSLQHGRLRAQAAGRVECQLLRAGPLRPPRSAWPDEPPPAGFAVPLQSLLPLSLPSFNLEGLRQELDMEVLGGWAVKL